ncbi:single-stranded DNA-binding protein [Candidatus Peregrinibacteria bacterium CG11_big_fil_rev_8_21_14_0_20_41_10]|nr:MAG: single-stranded DNA-binding protein [Candidatus Peregrinibacteria bacterium CG11_big_fil_rev_8_21_14_0_20_41_10]PIZ74828.1 MAG: single-stranded DNA-binding protein [Candidatus Peregrinibacteria bacterium CG_4_10_14_0_2_um_filter_41_8]PJC38190.1 MAG: single-stranded DNA-binding protein [Candidatus Peregrinibacteria bacterium CG_4_9_14_0_2_um_filter_41_14]
MRSVNKVILIGNLTRDPELKQTQSGQPLATFGIATNRTWTNSNGERQNSTEFHELVAWARLADFASQHLRKGKLIYIEGYLKTRSWETEDGTRRFKTEVIVQDLIILSKRGDEEGMDFDADAAQPIDVEMVAEDIGPEIEEDLF